MMFFVLISYYSYSQGSKMLNELEWLYHWQLPIAQLLESMKVYSSDLLERDLEDVEPFLSIIGYAIFSPQFCR